MILLVENPDERTRRTAVDDGGALLLVGEQLFVGQNLLAPFVRVAASEHQFAQEVASHPVNAVELGLLAAIRAGVGVLLEPLILAVTTERLLAILALDGVLKDIVADAADQLRQKRLHLGSVEDLVLFIIELHVHRLFVHYALH